MEKNQTIIKDTQSQGQGVCEKIFKALNLTSIFRYFSRNPKSEIATSDHHQKSNPARTTEFKLVVPQQDQNLSFASNKVHVEYNHSEVTMSKTESPVHMVAERDYPENARFSTYINHVKNKIMSSCDDDDDDNIDDKHKHHIDPSKFDIRTTAIACGGQG
ncbi:hypothetical protein R3W88_025152 [Solanum pinnatisectum]|uniref:Uncharacterized protein n=1 Tax=Solanum pinnatisectum TaxID=50273 RepID=A0AAV9M4F5_9SOLN|nr:hypothetical protein R3W88_025152 [Solanum pinnatisectum]